MGAESITVPWGATEKITLDLPDGWHVIGVLEPEALPPVPDVDEAVKAALQSPVGAPPLRTLAEAAETVVILVDDLSRPTPAHLLMPHVVGALEAGGVARAKMTIVTTLGTHRDMTQEDLAKKTGGAWAGAIRWENHAYTDPEKNVLVGTTRRGTPVYLNKTAAAADLVVSLGVIEPHVIAGFGGGYKNLIPGAAGAQTIGATHTLNLTPATYNMAGRPPEENPMRLDLEEGGDLLGKPFFIVNTVLNSRLEIVHVAAGHPIAAHREGIKVSARMCGVRIPREADVLITDSYPMDLDLRQGLKALANGIRAVRKGGLLIDLVRAEEGVGHMGMGRKKPPFGRGMLRFLAPLLLWALPRKRAAAQGEEDKFFTYFALQALRRNDLVLYGPTIPREFAQNVPFVEFAWTIDEMWKVARKRFPGKAEVLVFPAGGVTYPIV